MYDHTLHIIYINIPLISANKITELKTEAYHGS